MQEVSLQYAPIVAKPVIHVSQYDVGRQFKFKIYDGATAYTMPVGTTARVEGIKPDGHGFSYDDCVSVTDNIATVTTKLQMTIVAGSVECELRFSDGSDDIGTLNFTFLVEESPVNPDTDISDTEIPAIIELARAQMENAEAWAVGERNGVPVGPTDPTYHNNAKYYSDHAGGVSLDGLTDVDIQSLTNGQYIKYNSTTQKWENTSDVAEKTNTSDFLSLSNYGTQIPDNSDLNSYITPGKYYVSNGTSANTLSNAPTITGGFTMFVLERTNGPQRTQIIYMNNSGACDQYIRNHDTNTHNWSSWQKIAYDSQIQTLANGLSTETTNRENADNDIISTMSANGAHNLFSTPEGNGIIAGLTVIKNADESFSVTGGTTSGSGFVLPINEAANYADISKRLKPSTTYKFSVGVSDENMTLQILCKVLPTDSFSTLVSTANVSEVEFTTPASFTAIYARVSIPVSTVVPSMTLKPMIKLATDKDNTYLPYAKTNREITDELSYETGFCTKVTTSPVDQNAINVYRYGKVIVVALSVKFSATATGPVTVGTLTKYLPPNMVIGVVTVGPNTSTAYVDTDGNIKLAGNVPNVGAWLYGQIVYVIK